MPGLRADYPWHARCLPGAHAAHTRRAVVAHPHPTKQDCSSGWAEWQVRGRGQAECMPHIVGVQAALRHGMGPS